MQFRVETSRLCPAREERAQAVVPLDSVTTKSTAEGVVPKAMGDPVAEGAASDTGRRRRTLTTVACILRPIPSQGRCLQRRPSSKRKCAKALPARSRHVQLLRRRAVQRLRQRLLPKVWWHREHEAVNSSNLLVKGGERATVPQQPQVCLRVPPIRLLEALYSQKEWYGSLTGDYPRANSPVQGFESTAIP